jgi:hypothetical protein
VSYFDWLEGINREHREKDEEFQRLLCEPSSMTPEVGDTVIVAAGLLCRGFNWIRLEAEVLALGETSVKVRFVGREFNGKPDEEWIHPALITDVIRRVETEKTTDGQ